MCIPNLVSFWKSLPPHFRHLLIVGSVGRQHLLNVFIKIVELLPSFPQPHAEKVMGLAVDVFLAAWEADPLDHRLLRLFSSCPPFRERLPTQMRNLVNALGIFWNTPIPGERLEMLGAVKETPLGLTPFSLAWWRHMRMLSALSNRWDWFEELLEYATWPGRLDNLRLRLLVDAATFLKKRDKARTLLSSLSQSGFMSTAGTEWFLGRLSLRDGDRHGAISSWRRCLISRPWHVNLILRLYDLLCGTDSLLRFPLGTISVCLYSYNKADALNETLSSLAESELRDARLFLLINGSTDGSLEIGKLWQERFGKDRLTLIPLPVNVGAPAARNWLMAHPVVQNSDWIAYLDDDVFLPSDWLSRLGAAAERYPEGGVYGCKVVDNETPYLIQSADYHLIDQRSTRAIPGKPPYCLSMLHYEVEDLGDFDYLRPCIHVVGCCHLFPRSVLMQCGDFDLRYSPSQFDDVDHDFQLALIKKPAIYSGFLTVRHMNNTAKMHRRDPDARLGGQANWFKLINKFYGKSFNSIYHLDMSFLWNDLLNKLDVVQNVLTREEEP